MRIIGLSRCKTMLIGSELVTRGADDLWNRLCLAHYVLIDGLQLVVAVAVGAMVSG